MRYFSFWGTHTGRLNTQKPHPYMDIRDVRPKGTPMVRDITPVSVTHDEIAVDRTKDGRQQALENIRKVLFNLDYRKLEERILENTRNYYLHNYLFDFKSLKYEIPKTWQPVKSQGIYVAAKPIDLIPLETFRVEMTIPQPAHTKLPAVTIGQLQDLLAPKCRCEMKILMRTGCQCNGV
jgi:hypothetical protein